MSDVISSGIIATKLPICMLNDGSTGDQYLYRMVGKIFTKAIEELTKNIYAYIETAVNIKSIIFDISEADDIHFKHARFFSLCDNVNKKCSIRSPNISFEVIIGEQLKNKIIGIEDAFRFSISVKNEPPAISRSNYNIINIINTMIDPILVYGFTFPFMLICLFGMVWAMINLSQTLYGFAIFFSSGILIYESIILIRIYHKTKVNQENTYEYGRKECK